MYKEFPSEIQTWFNVTPIHLTLNTIVNSQNVLVRSLSTKWGYPINQSVFNLYRHLLSYNKNEPQKKGLSFQLNEW